MPGAEVPSITAPGGDVPTVGTSAPDVAVDASVPKPDAPKVDASDIPLAAAAAGGLGAAGAGLAAAAADKPKKSGFGRLFSRKGKKSTESAPPAWFIALSCRVPCISLYHAEQQLHLSRGWFLSGFRVIIRVCVQCCRMCLGPPDPSQRLTQQQALVPRLS